MKIKNLINTKMIQLTIDSRLESVSLVGLAVRGICSSLSLSEKELFRIEVCAVEAVNNVIKHAYQSAADREVEITVSIFQDRLMLQICDTGIPFELEDEQNPTFEVQDINSLPESGMGIFIMNSIMDDVCHEIIQGRNICTMIKYLNK